MDDQTFQLIMFELTDIKTKVNELIAFKHYFIGVSAVIASIVSLVFSLLSNKFFG